MVTIEVRTLYASISNTDGISVTKRALLKNKDKTFSIKIIKVFPTLIFTLDTFVFSSISDTFVFSSITTPDTFVLRNIPYLQIKDYAMCTTCVPSYANIFVSEFEDKYIKPYIKNMPMLNLRYTGNMPMIWNNM